MVGRPFAADFLGVLCLMACNAPSPALATGIIFPEILGSRPHDTSAFTEGLLIDNHRLYESTGHYGQSKLREIDLTTGGVLREIGLATAYFGEGLAAVDGHLIQLTWKEQVAFVYDIATFAKIGELSYTGEGWGLCYDGARLVMSNGSSGLQFRDPTSFALLGTVDVTLDGMALPRINELECANGAVFANIWYSDVIVRIEPSTGVVTAQINCSGLLTAEEKANADVLNGIAFDTATGTFFITGKYWPKIFEVRFDNIVAHDGIPTSDGGPGDPGEAPLNAGDPESSTKHKADIASSCAAGPIDLGSALATLALLLLRARRRGNFDAFCTRIWRQAALIVLVSTVLSCAAQHFSSNGPGVVIADPASGSTVVAPDTWWLTPETACPDGAVLTGAAPPDGTEIGCVRESGVWHGRRTTWYEDCGGKPCREPPIRCAGSYRRGIEHGRWIWWRPDGTKGLEGDYYAGRKIGVWWSWDPAGRAHKSQLEPPPPPTADVDRAVLNALAAAAQVGSRDLKRELDSAARDLKVARVELPPPASVRGLTTAEMKSIDIRATPGSGTVANWGTNIPKPDIGRISFGGGQDRDTSPYIRGVTETVTRHVVDCYRAALAYNQSLAGQLVARYTIDLDGDVLDALVVQSDLPETMNECVRDTIARLNFEPHNSGQDIQVITPWTFRAP